MVQNLIKIFGASKNHSLWRVACSFTSLISKKNSSSTVCASSNSLLWKTVWSTLGRWVAYHSLKWNWHPCIQEGIFTHVEWINLIATKQTSVKILQHVWSRPSIAGQSVSLVFEINMYWQCLAPVSIAMKWPGVLLVYSLSLSPSPSPY